MVRFTYLNFEIVLPSPRLNDTESLILNTHIDRAMSGKIISFKRQSVPQTQLSLFFEHVNRPIVLQLIDFLSESVSNTVDYFDYDNIHWRGTLLTTDLDTTHVDIRNNQFTLEFEGARA